MKNLYYNLILVLLFSFTQSCIEDPNDFNENESFNGDPINKKEGYIPLAPNMYWYYENATAELNTVNGVWEYENTDLPESEVMVTGIVKSIINPNTENSTSRVTYKLSPIADGGLLGNLVGNSQQIYKNFETGEYFKSEIITLSVPSTDSEDMENKLVIELKDYPFLKDDAKPNDVLYKKTETVIGEPKVQGAGSSKLVYEYTIKVQDVYDRIPSEYAQIEGVDKHLLQFIDVIHIREELKIISFETTGATVRSEFNGEVIIAPENSQSFFQANILTSHSIEGRAGLDLSLFNDPLFVALLPGIISTGPNPDDFSYNRTFDSESLSTFAPSIRAKLCPARGDLSNASTTAGTTLEIISNQVPFTRDVFYARNIGKIKSISSIRQISGQVNMRDVEFDDPDPLEILLINENCIDDINTMELQIVGKTFMEETKFFVPLLFGENQSIVSNIRKYNIK